MSDSIATNISFDIVTQIKNSNNSYIIIDGAGMGKTTFARYLVQEVLFKSDKIPILFDLRKIEINTHLIDCLTKELDFPWKTFSRDLFYKLLSINKFIIILDGFDEIPPSNQESISNQINEFSIKCGDNSILLTSRPQDGLPDIVNGKLLKFEELSLEQVKSILLKYDKCSSSKVGENLIEQLSKVPSNFLRTPLIVSLLYKTFGFSNSIADRLCTFYDDVYQALYKGHDLINKGGFSRKKQSNLDYEEFRQLVRAFCFYMTVRRTTSFTDRAVLYNYLNESIKLTSVKPSSINNFLSDLLTSVPLMIKEGNEYKFIHKTVLEYFSAEYVIYHPESKKKLELISKSNSFSFFEKVLDFIYDINKSLFNQVITKPFADMFKDKVPDDRDVISNLIITANEMSICKFGLFSKQHLYELSHQNPDLNFMADFNDPNDEIHKLTMIAHNSAPFENGVGYGSTTDLININNNQYILIFSWANKNNNMHKCAFKELSKEISHTEFNSLFSKDITQENLDSISINNWLTPDEKTHKPFLTNNVSLNFFMNAVNSMHDNSTEPTAKYFSQEKIDNLLHNLNQDCMLNDEIDSLLQ